MTRVGVFKRKTNEDKKQKSNQGRNNGVDIGLCPTNSAGGYTSECNVNGQELELTLATPTSSVCKYQKLIEVL